MGRHLLIWIHWKELILICSLTDGHSEKPGRRTITSTFWSFSSSVIFSFKLGGVELIEDICFYRMFEFHNHQDRLCWCTCSSLVWLRSCLTPWSLALSPIVSESKLSCPYKTTDKIIFWGGGFEMLISFYSLNISVS